MEFETDYITFSVKNKILIAAYKQGLHINLTMAKEIVQARIDYTNGTKMPSLILSQGVISMDKPTREYLSSEAATQGLLASAIIVTSPFSSFLGNFFLFVNKPKIPVRIFSSMPIAERWLEQFIV